MKNKETILQKVARIAKVSEGHVRQVSCGNKKSKRITALIIKEKERELVQLRASIINEANTDCFKKAS